MGEKPSDKRRRALPDLACPDEERENTKRESTKVKTAASKAKGRDRPFLIVIAGGSVGQMYPVRQDEMVIGRARSCSIRLDDDGISRRHAKIISLGSQVHIEDLGSTNGTFVNGEKLASRRPLTDGDKITIGSTSILKFTYSDDLDETFQRRMFEAALRDGLTGAHNNRSFLDHLTKELAYARRHSTPLSLIILDVDHFKKVNDTWGHPAGDSVLTELSRVAIRALREEDVFARHGGEEFAVICRGTDAKGAAVVAERLRELIAKMRVSYAGREIAVTVSLGVACHTDVDAERPAQLIAEADEALYQAKREGRNRVVVRAIAG
jgi:diguanylate cyclase (GGDEF)-like protein